MTSSTTEAVALLESRCRAIDAHYARFPNSVDRTMAETASAIRTVIEALSAPVTGEVRQSPPMIEIAKVVDRVLHGITFDEGESDHGWWSTSTGVSFGTAKRAEMIEAIAELMAAHSQALSASQPGAGR